MSTGDKMGIAGLGAVGIGVTTMLASVVPLAISDTSTCHKTQKISSAIGKTGLVAGMLAFAGGATVAIIGACKNSWPRS